jgi:hypothetical protein
VEHAFLQTKNVLTDHYSIVPTCTYNIHQQFDGNCLESLCHFMFMAIKEENNRFLKPPGDHFEIPQKIFLCSYSYKVSPQT